MFSFFWSIYVHANTDFSLNGNSTVCQLGCDFSDLNIAIDATRSGGTVYIKAETLHTCGVINKPIKILGELKGGAMPHLNGTSCVGKGALVIEANNVEISNLEISNINVSDKNGACIRAGKGARNLNIKNIFCHDSQNGILASFGPGNLNVSNSVFERCGYGGQAHGSYIQVNGNIYFKNVKFLSSKGSGHSLKISAKNILIENSVIAALNGHNSRAIDLFGGGVLVVRNSVLQQGPYSENTDMIGVAMEKSRVRKGKHSIVLENNWFIFDNQKKHYFKWLVDNRGKLFRGDKLGEISVINNKIVGMADVNMKDIIFTGNEVFESRQDAGLIDYNGTINSLPITLVR